MFIQKSFELKHEEEEFIKFFLSDSFPWYFQPTTTDRFMFFGHALMKRDPEHKPVSGLVSSPYYPICENIFIRFCQENNIKIKNILRAAVNMSLYDPAEVNDIHIDHKFEHYNFLMYLNEFDNGCTLIYDKDLKMTKKIIPKKYDAVVFGGEPHAHEHCAVGQRRLVLVVTFTMENI